MSQALVPDKIKIEIIGAAAEVFGRRSCEMDARPEMTLRDLLAGLARDAGPGFREKVYDRETGKMNEHLSVFVNSREARSLRGPGHAAGARRCGNDHAPHGRRLRERQVPGRC